MMSLNYYIPKFRGSNLFCSKISMAAMSGQYVAWAIFLYQGVGNLFPWNAFINAGAYFGARFCPTPFVDSFENYFSFGFTASQTLGLMLSIKYGKHLSLRSKIAVPLLLQTVLLLATSLFVVSDLDSTLLFWLTLLTTLLLGFAGAILSGGLFGLAAIFPPHYTGAMMTGQSLAGLVVSVSDILTLVSGKMDPSFCASSSTESESCAAYKTDFSSLAYFLIATFILASCAWAFFALQSMRITKYSV
jgi:equilibrative nucleoside transporter 1/2/3